MEKEYYVECEHGLWLAVKAESKEKAKAKVKEFKPTGKVKEQ